MRMRIDVWTWSPSGRRSLLEMVLVIVVRHRSNAHRWLKAARPSDAWTDILRNSRLERS